jgi:hypothetical protein
MDCTRCRVRRSRGAAFAPGARCAVCATSDVRVLSLRTLREGPRVLCANCAAVLGRRAMSIAALRTEMRPPGDPRQAERRTGDRRSPLERRAARGAGALEERRGETTDRRRSA